MGAGAEGMSRRRPGRPHLYIAIEVYSRRPPPPLVCSEPQRLNRLVHYYFNLLGQPNKKRILSRNNAYHRTTYLSASLTGIASNDWEFDTLDW